MVAPRHRVAVLAAALTAAVLAVAGAGPSGAATRAGPHPAAGGARATSTAMLQVGSVRMTRCDVVQGAWCGSIRRAWDPTGRVPGDLSVGFAFRPATDAAQPALGTLVPREGGPGYSTTGTGPDYAAMYGPLLDRRNLLLVDQRGTGLTAAIGCPTLQDLTGSYAPAAAACAARLGPRFDLYGTALSADDLSAVITALGLGPVDLYGDSYGTFFSQVFLGRHPGQLRSVVLDSAYPTYGETAWYPTQTAAMDSSFDKVCARTPSCAALGGSTIGRLRRLLAVVRRAPIPATATGADGRFHRVEIDGPELVMVAFGATFGSPTYREFDPAIRAALAGDPAPMARLIAEEEDTGADGPAEAYSEGLDAAVSCQDYPQLYDMSAPPAQREQQYLAARAQEHATDPGLYAPFTIGEYLSSDWEEQDWCRQWPAAAAPYTSTPPTPPSGHYAAVPTLILSGELDSITTPAEGAIVASQIPGARQVVVANSFHVTATDDTDGCGRSLVQAFVTDPRAALPAVDLACAANVPPVRGSPAYVSSFRQLGAGSEPVAAARGAALTVADIMDRWLDSYAGTGTGLRGGTWTSQGYDTVTLRLKDVRLFRDLGVSGSVVWDRYAHTAVANLHLHGLSAAGSPVSGSPVTGALAGSWDTRAAGATADLSGRLGGHPVSASFPAP